MVGRCPKIPTKQTQGPVLSHTAIHSVSHTPERNMLYLKNVNTEDDNVSTPCQTAPTGYSKGYMSDVEVKQRHNSRYDQNKFHTVYTVAIGEFKLEHCNTRYENRSPDNDYQHVLAF